MGQKELQEKVSNIMNENSKYFRVRMKFNSWYVFFYDKNLKELEWAKGPFGTNEEATKVGDDTGLIDMDKSNVPLNV